MLLELSYIIFMKSKLLYQTSKKFAFHRTYTFIALIDQDLSLSEIIDKRSCKEFPFFYQQKSKVINLAFFVYFKL